MRRRWSNLPEFEICRFECPPVCRNEKGQAEYNTTGLNTDIDIRDGQKVVVGKSDVNNGENPLILDVTAKVGVE